MKKLALIICVLMLFSMVACTNNKKPGTTTPGTTTPGTTTPGTTTPGTTTPGTTTPGNTNTKTQTLTGKAQGYGGEVTVKVMVNGDDIVSVEAMGEKETKGIGSNAIDQLPGKIAEADSTDVAAVSGATVTSKAIKEAVNEALKGKK